MPRINDPLQGMGVWRLVENALPSKANPGCFARVKAKIRFPGTYKSTLSKDIQSQSDTNDDRAWPRSCRDVLDSSQQSQD
jgi:hypothetical protein